MSHPSELIDRLIAETPGWRGAVFANIRRIIHEADPEITEELKWQRPTNPTGSPVFEHNGIVCILVVLKERVRLSFNYGASLADPERLFNAMLEGNKLRAVDFQEDDVLNETALKALVRSGVDHNLAKAKSAKKPAGG